MHETHVVRAIRKFSRLFVYFNNYGNCLIFVIYIVICRGKIDDALESYQKLLAYTRSAPDVKNAMVMVSSVEAQLDMKKNFGLEVPNIFNN